MRPKKIAYLATTFVFALLPTFAPAQGIDITSGGTMTVTGTATIDISDGGITNNGTYTKGSETVTLNGTTSKSISGANTLSVNNLMINSTGTISLDNSVNATTMTINPNAKVTNSTGKTLAGTTMNIKSDASGTGTYVDNGSSTSFTNTNVEQYLTGSGVTIPNNRFWYISSPLNVATASGFAVGATSKLWYYDETIHNYTAMTGSETLEMGRGYVSRLASNRTVTLTGDGAVLNNGDKTVTLNRQSDANAKRGYNLIGNPYPSFVTLDYAADGVNIESTIWFRSLLANNTGMAFDTYNILSHESISTQSGSGALTQYIAPLQAFWVRATVDQATVTFRQASRSHNATVKLRDAGVAEAQKIRLQVSNGTVSDETLIGFYPNAVDAFDPYDSHKMPNENASMPEIFTYSGAEELAINGLSPLTESRELPLGFRTGKAGTFTLKASEILNLEEGTNVFLKDKQLNSIQNLTEAPIYSFTSDAITTADRFSIVINKVATKLTETVGQPSYTVYTELNGTIHVQLQNMDRNGTQIKLYGVSGQLLLKKVADGTLTSFKTNLPKGLYLIEVSREGFVGRNKIVVQN